jgi:regulator of RNase E activity RraB
MGAVDEGRWNFFQRTLNDKPASIFLDLDAHKHQTELPELLAVVVKLRMPHPQHGMTTQEEFETLTNLEDVLVSHIRRPVGTRYVGRITTDGKRIFFFYSAHEFQVDLEPILKRFPGYEIQSRWRHDPKWGQYRHVLFPSEEEMQGIRDRAVVQQLQKVGDALTVVRPVRHWSYFAESAARDAFLDQVKAGGFTVVSAEDVDPKHVKDGLRVVAFYVRSDPVAYKSITDVTRELFRLSKQYGGRYDGWETPVVKSDSRPG